MAAGTCNSERSELKVKADDGIRWNVTCGVTEIPDSKTVTIMYTIPDHVEHVSWEWQHQTLDDGTKQHVAQMVGSSSNRGHKSKPVPDPIYRKLGSPKKSRESIYLKVKMKRKDEVSIEEFFNT